MKDVQGMDTIDNGFNIYCYSTICSYINMVLHYHKFISIVLVKNNARELVKCESLKTLFFFRETYLYLFSIFFTESGKSTFGNFLYFFIELLFFYYINYNKTTKSI